MGALPKTDLVVPCYNEASRLPRSSFVEAVRAEPALHLTFVDDGSTDDTPGLLDALCTDDPAQIQVVHLAVNSGKAEAVRQGMLRALQNDVQLVGYWDADLATSLDQLGPMVELMERLDAFMAMGSRVRLLGRQIERAAGRHYLGRLFATATSAALGLPVYDTQCGAKLLRNNALAHEIFAEPFSSRWIFDVEIIARCMQGWSQADADADRAADSGRPGRAIVEYPLTAWSDVEGSKLRPRDFGRAAVDLAQIAWRLRCR